MILHVYVDEVTHERLLAAARDTGRNVLDLAECAISEASLEWAKRNVTVAVTKQLPLVGGE